MRPGPDGDWCQTRCSQLEGPMVSGSPLTGPRAPWLEQMTSSSCWKNRETRNSSVLLTRTVACTGRIRRILTRRRQFAVRRRWPTAMGTAWVVGCLQIAGPTYAVPNRLNVEQVNALMAGCRTQVAWVQVENRIRGCSRRMSSGGARSGPHGGWTGRGRVTIPRGKWRWFWGRHWRSTLPAWNPSSLLSADSSGPPTTGQDQARRQ